MPEQVITSQNRETALKNAIMRTTRFDSITINGITQILTDLTNSFYRVVISRAEGTSVIEILNKQIISVNAAKVGETYSINETSFIISGIIGPVVVSVEYYESFKFEVKSSTHGVSQSSELVEYYIRTVDTLRKNGKDYYIFNGSVYKLENEKDFNDKNNTNIYYEKHILDKNHHYFQPVHADDIYAEKLNVNTIQTNSLNCNEIILGNWKISMESSTEAVISHT